MRLHVGELRIEQLLGPVDRELFGDVDTLAAAVVALAGIAFRVLVGELRTLRRHDRRTRVILGGDQLDVGFLAVVLATDGLPELGVRLLQGLRTAEHEGFRHRKSYYFTTPCA